MVSSPLIHIGYAKTGTKWLQGVLFVNPEVGFVTPVSLRAVGKYIVGPHPLDFQLAPCRAFFDQELEKIGDRSLIPVVSCERLVGSANSGGHDSATIADRLAAVFPDARILMVIREQKSIIYSTYNQYVVKGGGTLSLAAYLEAPKIKKTPVFDYRHFKYHRLIQYYFSLFGKERVCVLPYELFKTQPAAFMSSVLTFCGLPAERTEKVASSLNETINPSASAFEIAATKYTNILFGRRTSLNQSSLLPLQGKRRFLIANQIRRIERYIPQSYKASIAKKLRDEIAERVGDRYKGSNHETAALTGIDLAAYGYDM